MESHIFTEVDGGFQCKHCDEDHGNMHQVHCVAKPGDWLP